MPTAAGSDVIPLRKGTKRRLVEAKDDASFDELVSELLDAVPPDALRERIIRRRTARSQRPGPERALEKQLATARLAAERWRLNERDGRIVRLGPKLVSWRTQTNEGPEENVRIRYPARRGFSP